MSATAGPGASLSAKQERFVEEYLVDLNATQAAIRAGYSKKSAHVQGPRLLGNARVSTAIASAKADRSRRSEITQDMVLAELAKVGFSDPRNVFSAMGGIVEPQDWGDNTAGAISSVEVVRRQSGEHDEDGRPLIEHVHKIRFWDKISALEKIGKHLGMFEGQGQGEEKAQPLRFDIHVNAPAGSVRVTKPE